MALRDAAVAQVVLEGVPLPAAKSDLLKYARAQRADERVLSALAGIADQEYKRLDDVGEAIARVQPAFTSPSPHEPDVESDEVPGGSAYTDPNEEPGWVRDEPDVLPYERQLVREPAPVGDDVPHEDEDKKPVD